MTLDHMGPVGLRIDPLMGVSAWKRYLSAHERQPLLQLSQLRPLSLDLAFSLPVDVTIVQDRGWPVGKPLTGNIYTEK